MKNMEIYFIDFYFKKCVFLSSYDNFTSLMYSRSLINSWTDAIGSLINSWTGAIGPLINSCTDAIGAFIY